MTIILGSSKFIVSADAVVLTSENAKDENTLEEPTKVSPKNKTLNFSGNKIKHAFPGNSLTVIRVRAVK